MNIQILISHIHWLPVVVMTIFSFVLGILWHQPALFGQVWAKENYPNGVRKNTMNLPLMLGGTAIMNFLAVSAISAAVSGMRLTDGLTTGFLISIVFVLPAMAGTYLFANRSVKLLAIDAGMYVVLFTVCGLVLSVW